MHFLRHDLIGFDQQIEIRQGVEIGRPSTMLAKVDGVGERIDSVRVAGSAVVVAKGALEV